MFQRLGFLFLITSSAFGGVIDFESFADGTILTSQYPGLTFMNATIVTAGITLNEFDFPPHSGTNVIFDDSGPTTIQFTNPILTFSAYVTYITTVTVNAYENATIVGTTTSLFANNTGTGGDAGSTPNEQLTVASNTGITSITITGDNQGSSFTMDDVAIGALGVPEPTSGALVMSVLIVVLLRQLFIEGALKKHRMHPALRVIALVAILMMACTRAPAATGPTITSMSAIPTLISPGVPTNVSVMVAITDSTLIAGSVNLLCTYSNGTTSILGQLHDDGQNGDIEAGDNVYTILLPIKAIGDVQLQASAAFRGVLKRATSTVVTLAATQQKTLPPDPGSAGLLTLNGTDSDHDGIRDDVERYIYLTYPTSQRTQAALTQLAAAELAMIQDATNPALSRAHTRQELDALDCLSASTDPAVNYSTLDELRAHIANTADRAKAYFQAAGQTTSLFMSLPQNGAVNCAIDPGTYPN